MNKALNLEFDSELKLLIEAIEHHYNFDFKLYAVPSMRRRINLALVEMKFNSISELQKQVLADVNCFNDLIDFLTVSVTEMFRDPTYFLGLSEKVLPVLQTYPSLKIWIAGCSTGEEIHSMAILLREQNLLERTIIYATDINSRSLEKAKAGVFDLKTIEKSAVNYKSSGGSGLLSDYYTVNTKKAIFDPDLIKNVTFSDHSLVTDAVFSEMNLISCRNVLIYFERELQSKVIGLFKDSLCRKGFLGLGSKETLQFSNDAKSFDPFVKKDRIFQKNNYREEN